MISGYDKEVEFLKEAASIYVSLNEEYNKICGINDHKDIFLKVKNFVSHLSITKNFIKSDDLLPVLYESIGLLILDSHLTNVDSVSVEVLKDYVIVSKLMSYELFKEANSLKGVGNVGKKSDALSKAKILDEISGNLHESMVKLEQLIENFKKD